MLTGSALLDAFFLASTFANAMRSIVPAPAALVLEIAPDFDMQSILPVRAIF